MKKAKGLTAIEQGLLKDLDELNIGARRPRRVVEGDHRQDEAAARRRGHGARRTPRPSRAAMATAYVHLEGEIDAFRVEGEVKAAFGAANRTWKPPKRKSSK